MLSRCRDLARYLARWETIRATNNLGYQTGFASIRDDFKPKDCELVMGSGFLKFLFLKKISVFLVRSVFVIKNEIFLETFSEKVF